MHCGVVSTSNPDPFLVIHCADRLPWLCPQLATTHGNTLWQFSVDPKCGVMTDEDAPHPSRRKKLDA